MKLAIFDLDHTLLDGDSDVLWCEFLMRQGLLDRGEFLPRNEAMAAAYRAGTVDTFSFCSFYVGTLAGRTVSGWQPLCQQFLREEIASRLPPAAHRLVQQHQEAGDTVVLSTATNRVITALTAEHLGIAHLLATECETAPDGVLTGKVSGTPNMREGKVLRLQAWLAARGIALEDCSSTFYSDSMNDLPLLLAANRPVLVNADPRLAAIGIERGWPALQLHHRD